ncbi:hypothetical protein PR003_g6185 [Phytophthora rubi]|uniref:Calmodulin n=1 Tax=Phytophthora rubi TaxID=129364 RepID=A0A6A3N2J1_9STRA|nr:hypothetical protein PR002_g10185 [Phytophthora rubi]KAE9035754.1 hypothetical protein PR001_g9171 [Phytophthora rubi]KAE9348874.1 hypothetical protein PR003_g6185 [Phytophthora rubi]
MGTSISKASPLAPTFERMATWDLKSSRRLLQDYKDKDLDFGLDAQGLADLLGGDKDWAESIIDAFSSPTGIINALAFICGVCLVCSGPALEKAGMIFDALDFDGTEQISMDEMTISFLCSTRGFCVITGVGAVPSDEELESVTLQAYRDLNKGSTQSITKAEFMKWIIEFASGTGAPPTREVTLQNALEQFRVVPPSENTDEKEENNGSTPLQDDSEEDGTEYPDEAVQNDEHLEDPLHQETDMPNAGEFTVDQEHDSIEQATELIEPEYVATEIDGQLLSDGDGIADGHNEFNLAESETGVDDGGQTEADVESVAQMNETQEALETEQIANDDNEPGLETENHLEAAAGDTESDYPTFVADGDELPQGSESFTNEEHDQNASGQELCSDFDAATFETGTGLDVQQDNAQFESQDTDPVAPPEKLVAGDLPPEPASADDDDLSYEQDDFAQETPRAEREAEPVDETYPADNLEDASPKDATEEPEPATAEGETEVIAAQDVVVHNIEVDETPPPAPLPGLEPAATTLTPENTGEEGATEAPVDEAAAVDEVAAIDPDPAEETSATDMNAYDTYDYEQPQFDGSSGLPPPEPQELIDDAAVEAAQEAADAPEENPAE